MTARLLTTPRLVVTIDTEEEGLWGGQYRARGNTVENIQGVPRFQALCDRFGVRPTYLCDAPVVSDDRAVDILGQIAGDGRAEIGGHLHPWCNPPFEEQTTPRNSFLCNLPSDLQRAKLTWLTDRIVERFGSRPLAFRAGRYGLDATGALHLAALGYRVDSSVIAFSDFRAAGGPDFRRAPWCPYFVAGDNLLTPHESGHLLEVPVTVGYSHRRFLWADALRTRAASSPWRQLKAVSVVDRLGLARRIKLCPEQAGQRHMIQLVDAMLAQQAPVAVLMFHSSSLVPGLSPYVTTAARLERFLSDLAGVFEHCLATRGMQSATLGALAELFPAAA